MKRFTLLLAFLSFVSLQVVMAQTREISGNVTSADDGSTIPGVSVVVKGTTVGTVTDFDGHFTLKVPSSSKSLLFTFVGMTTQEVAITEKSTYAIKMSSQNVKVDEVVVVAYGTAKKSSITGAASSISSQKLADRPLTSVVKALEGSAPGIQVTSGNGQPGSAPEIRIRGFGSINATSEPLYVVDGVPYNLTISNLNMDDVESVSVLKDASSTALYGSRAANGVVMITTKKGKSTLGDKIQFKLSQGITQRALPEYERVNAFQYYPLMWQYYRNGMVNRTSNPLTMAAASSIASGLTAGQPGIKDKLSYNPFTVAANAIVSPDGVMNPDAKLLWGDDLDWAAPLTRTGNRSDYSMNINGGNEKTTYYLSLGYLMDQGFVIKSDFERFSARASVDSKIKDYLKIGLALTGNSSRANYANDESSTGYVNPFFFSRTIAPIYPVYAHDPANGNYILGLDGQKQYDFGNSNVAGVPQRAGYGGRNIVAETNYNTRLLKRNVISARTYAEIYFLKDFKFTTNVGLDVSSYNDGKFENRFVGDAAPSGRSNKTNSLTTTLNFNQLLTYNKSFGKHNVDALLGHESYKYTYNYLYGMRTTSIVDGNNELINFITLSDLTSYTNVDRLESYISRLNYNYDNKYFASASYRRDGSSHFSPDARWGNFFGFGAAWRLDQEEFIKSIPAISLLKLRSSYGETGNNDAGLYAWQALYMYNINAAEGGVLQNKLSNLDLTWEKNATFDVAAEFELFKRISGTVEFYNRQSSNLLFSVPKPLSSGIENYWMNIGTMYNRGVEIQLSGDVIKKKNFSWNLTVNASTFKNEITKLPQSEIISGSKKLMVGHSMYDYWLREFVKVDPNTGYALYRAKAYDATNSIIDGQDTLSWNANNARYHYKGSSIPKLYGSVSNTFSYKGFDLTILVTYQIGGKIYETNYASLMSPGYGTSIHIDALKAWQKAGDVTNVPRLDEAWSAHINAGSDRWLKDASFMNLKQISLGYKVPERVAAKAYINNARVFITGENLWLGNALKGMNNQQNFNGTVSNVYAPARTFTIGVNFSL